MPKKLFLVNELNDHIRHWIGHAGQDKFIALFIHAQPRPINTVDHFPFNKSANASSTRTVSAGALQIEFGYFGCLCGLQKSHVCWRAEI